MNVFILDKIFLIRFAIEEIIKVNFKGFTTQHIKDYGDLNFSLSKKIPDILITDIDIPDRDGLEVIRVVHNEYPQIKIIVLSEHKEPEKIFTALQYGAKAYLLKNETSENEIIAAIRNVLENKDYFSDTVQNIILQNFVKNIRKGEEISEKKPRNLTRREIQILKLVCEGLTNKQIAEGLFISVRTVDAHKNHIMQKLGLKTTADLVKYAIKHGYVKLD